MPDVEVIRGREYHRGMILIARRARTSDGKQLVPADADEMFEIVKGSYGPLEKATVMYIRKKYMWSKDADERFRVLVRARAVEKRKITIRSKSTQPQPEGATATEAKSQSLEQPASPL